MPIAKDTGSVPPTLVVSRTPVGPATTDAGKNSVGDYAVNDALIIIGIAWAVVFLLMFSLRQHNI
jgi:hypothetical protein